MQIHEQLHANLWHVLRQISVNIISLFKVFHFTSDFILKRLKIERLFQAPTVQLAKTHAPVLRCSRKGRHPQKAYASMLEGFIYKQLHFAMSEDKLQIPEQLEVTREKNQQSHLGQSQLLTPYSLTMHKSTWGGKSTYGVY